MSGKPFRTHYDNLQVARNASDAVIRAAYKSLAQNYHPDRAKVDPEEAKRVMQVINASYKVLSDPDTRHEHDLWIAEMEKNATDDAIAPQIEQVKLEQLQIASESEPPAPRAPQPINIGIQTHYESPRPQTTLASKLFGWLFVVTMSASMIPFVAQVIYWFRFKTWIPLPARLAFGGAGKLPESIGVVMPDKGISSSITEWLYHASNNSSFHQTVYSILDSINVSIFYLLATIVIFYIAQFIRDRFA